MTNNFKRLLLFCFCLIGTFVHAQQEAQFSNYIYQTQLLNPGYTGSRGYMSFIGAYRSQWVGLEGAPETQSISFQTPIGEKIGVGFAVQRDAIGPSIETFVTGDFSYAITMRDRETKLAFGLKAGMHSLDLDFSKIGLANPGDPEFTDVSNKIAPIVGAGLFLYNDYSYIGVSSPNLLQTNHFNEVANTTAAESIHLYIMAGYVFEINRDLKFKPAALIKTVSGAPLGIDISANFLINESLTLGASYKYEASVSAMAAFQVANSLMIGYAYDFDTSELAQYNSGSHEIFVRLEILGNNNRRNRTNRFF